MRHNHTVPATQQATAPTLLSHTIYIIRCVFTAVVVFIHTNLCPDTGCAQGMYYTLYDLAGHVLWLCNPIFFLLSGYLYFLNGPVHRHTFQHKCRNRWHSLVVPYLCWNTLVLLLFVAIDIFFPSLTTGTIPPLHKWDLRQVGQAYFCIYGSGWDTSPINGPLWFLRDLIILSALTPCIQWVVQRKPIALPLLISLMLAPLPFFFNISLPFFALGGYLSLHHKQPEQLSHTFTWGCLAIFVAIVAVLFCIPLSTPLTQPLHLIKTLCGMGAVVGLCLWLAQRSNCHMAAQLAPASFFVFAAHGVVARLLTKAMSVLLLHLQAGPVLYLLAHLANWALCVALCLVAYRLTAHYPALMNLLGGRRTRQPM